MELRHRSLPLTLLLAALVCGALLVAPAAPVAAQPGANLNVAHSDGYVTISPDGSCVVLKTHDGSLLALSGRWRGLRANDHVRIEGRLVPENRCGAPGGFEVTLVQAIWADDRHKTTYYDYTKDGEFRSWVQRNRPGDWDRGHERH